MRHRNCSAVMLGCIAFAALVDPGVCAGESRGQKWVREHPFTLMALTMSPQVFESDTYRAAGLNTLLAWKLKPPILEKAAADGLPWVFHLYPLSTEFTLEKAMEQARQVQADYPGGVGWLVWDEPRRPGMIQAAPLAQWLRRTYPDTLVFTNAYPMGASDEEMYGGPPPKSGYGYGDYLRDIVRIMRPDVLMYDAYIFKEGDNTSNLFPTISEVRRRALEAGIPYWAFVQSHQDPGRGYRMPSESDVRMQVFMHLTFGYTGIGYFTYEDAQGPAMISLDDGQPRPIYHAVAGLNREAANLGQTLRFLTSTDVRYVPPPDGSVPAGAVAWSPDAGDGFIEAIEIEGDDLAEDQAVLVGYFHDDAGGRYLMVTNLRHGAAAAAADRPTTVALTLRSPADAIQRLSRETGRPEAVTLSDGALTLTLPGGTGDLFKCDPGTFAGLQSRVD